MSAPTNRPWYVIVGVVADVKQDSLAINQPDAVYLSTEQTWFADDTLSFVIRTVATRPCSPPPSKTPSGPSTMISPSSASPLWTPCSPSLTRNGALS